MAIIEEIAVDAIVDDPKLISQMTKFMKGGKLSGKDRKKFFELLRTVVAREQAKVQPQRGRLNDLWSRVVGK